MPKHKIETTPDDSEISKKQRKSSDEPQEFKIPADVPSLDDGDAKMAAESRLQAGVLATQLPLLHTLVCNASLTDQQKITALKQRFKAKPSSIFERDEDDATLLHNACRNSGVELAVWLLQQDKDLMTAKTYLGGRNVLFYAAEYANSALVKFFLKQRPQLATECALDKTNVLLMAARGGDIEIFDLLLAQQKKPLSAEFFIPYWGILREAIDRGHLKLIQWLADHHMEFMISCNNLSWAIKHTKDQEIALFLRNFLASKAWLDYVFRNNLQNKPCHSFFPLHNFAEHGCVQNVQRLLDEKASVNLPTADEFFKDTPLSLAAAHGQLAVIKLLVKRGADTLHPNGQGRYPLQLAMRGNHTETVVWLLSHVPLYSENAAVYQTLQYAKPEPFLFEAIAKGNLEIIERLYQCKPSDITTPDTKGNYPIHIAVLYNQPQVVKWLLEKGVSPELPVKHKEDTTPLYIALTCGHFAVVEVLCAVKAKYTVAEEPSPREEKISAAENKLLRKLLFLAARDARALPILKNILAKNVDCNTPYEIKSDGEDPVLPASKLLDKGTALHEAIRHNNIEAVRCLVAKGAYIDFHDFVLAIQGGSAEIFSLLFAKLSGDITSYLSAASGAVTVNTQEGTHETTYYTLFSQPFPPAIFAIMRRGLPVESFIFFANNYLSNFCEFCMTEDADFDEAVLAAFFDLVKKDKVIYSAILELQFSKIDMSDDIRKMFFAHLLQPTVEADSLPVFLFENNCALLFKIIRSNDKESIAKILNHKAFPKDFKLLHSCLCNARDEGVEAILESVDKQNQQELILYNKGEALQKILDEGTPLSNLRTFAYLLPLWKDPILKSKFILQHLSWLIDCYFESLKDHPLVKTYLRIIFDGIDEAARNKMIYYKLHCEEDNHEEYEIIYSLLAYVKDSRKRRDYILTLAPKLRLETVTSDTGSEEFWGSFREKLDILLAFLDEEQDKQLFLSYIPIYPERRQWFDDYVRDEGLLTRSSAVNQICRMTLCDRDTVLAWKHLAKPLHAPLLTSANFLLKFFPESNADINLTIAMFLTGAAPNVTKTVMQTLHYGVKLRKEKGKTQPQSTETKAETPAVVVRPKDDYAGVTLFLQRMSICIMQSKKEGSKPASTAPTKATSPFESQLEAPTDPNAMLTRGP